MDFEFEIESIITKINPITLQPSQVSRSVPITQRSQSFGCKDFIKQQSNGRARRSLENFNRHRAATKSLIYDGRCLIVTYCDKLQPSAVYLGSDWSTVKRSRKSDRFIAIMFSAEMRCRPFRSWLISDLRSLSAFTGLEERSLLKCAFAGWTKKYVDCSLWRRPGLQHMVQFRAGS